MGLKKAFKKAVGKVTDTIGITDTKAKKQLEQTAEASRKENEIATAKLKAEAEKDQRLLGQQMAARRRSRRSGNGLLSDARLNAESGIQTLGGGNNLG